MEFLLAKGALPVLFFSREMKWPELLVRGRRDEIAHLFPFVSRKQRVRNPSRHWKIDYIYGDHGRHMVKTRFLGDL